MAAVIHSTDDFSVDIREESGTWIVQVNEAPEIYAEGATLQEAIEKAELLAFRPLIQLASADIRRAISMARAIDQWGEDRADIERSKRAMREETARPWSEVEKELDF